MSRCLLIFNATNRLKMYQLLMDWTEESDTLALQLCVVLVTDQQLQTSSQKAKLQLQTLIYLESL